MRFAWLGFHAEGLPALAALLADGAPITDVFTLRGDLAAQRRGGVDFRPVCERHGVALHEITNVNDPRAQRELAAAAPDVVFVIGWHQRVRAEALRIARIGMVGAHASLLPHNRGSAPVNWALLRGERECGNSLYWFTDTLDAGDLIEQVRIPITPYDSSASLYARVATTTREMLGRLVPRLLAGEVPRVPQPATTERPLPRRRAADGELDWAQPVGAVYDFIRALTRPFPGAFSSIDGHRWRVWQAAMPRIAEDRVPPGTVLGPVVSPVDEACGQLVACSEGALVVLEVEGDDGRVLRGRELSEQPWTGQRWRHG
jgi:methionyl-tRNA formyltransferase